MIGPNSSDGYKVTAAEAKCMAAAAEAVVSWWKFYQEEYDKLSPHQQKQIEDVPMLSPNLPWPLNQYRPLVREDFIEKTASFAKWAKQSGGFLIR